MTTPSQKTLPFTVHNVGFLLDRMGQDCHPLQFLRELTQNSIEAILRTNDQTGEIIWDVDWITKDLSGVYKLCITDNGDGMSGEEMVKYMNQLSSSFAEQSLSGNYGVGAKIAAATRNHEGLIYLSWQDGAGSTIHLWKDPVSNEYGLQQFELPNGQWNHHGSLEDAVKPDMIGAHGTKVVLLGNTIEDNTMEAPESAASPSVWISKYLNTRYFQFPQGITVKARQGWHYPREDQNNNILRTITGQKLYLEKHMVAHGRLKFRDATAYWWILKDEKALGSNSGFIESAGHIAALYDNELYELATARSGRARLQEFGVILGHRRVVIYVEPKSSSSRNITTNTARTHLLVNNESLPWSDWATEFRENLPEEIDKLIQEVAAGASEKDHSQSIRDRLKGILDLYKISRYRPSPDGNLMIDIDNTTMGRRPFSGNSGGSKKRRSRTSRNTPRNVYSVFLKEEGGVKGKEVNTDKFPEVMWVSILDGTREAGDIEDRAGHYFPEQNLLHINADFRVFADMVLYYQKDFGNNSAFKETIKSTVHAWFQQAMVETVLGVQALRNANQWSRDDINKALSEEALTSAVMQRYHVNISIKRELGAKLGGRKTNTSSKAFKTPVKV